MRTYRFVAVSALSALVMAGCAAHGSAISSAAIRVPQVVQTGKSPSQWVVFSTSFQPADITVGSDKQIWVSSQYSNSVYRVTVSTGAISTAVLLPFPAGPIVNGPDGNIWTCSAGSPGGLAKITTGFEVTTYPAPTFCGGIAVGSDGNIWFTSGGDCAIERSTTSGATTEFVSPYCPSLPEEILAGSDGNIWFTERGARGATNGVIRFAISKSSFAEFTTVKPLEGLALGSDGNLYSCYNPDAYSGGKLDQISSSGSMRLFQVPTRCISTQSISGSLSVYYTTESGNGARWNIKDHSDTAYGQSPSKDVSLAMTVGPDKNVWNADALDTIEVYVNRLLDVTPASATIAVHSSQSFSVTEINCSACAFSAKSSDPAVATSSSVKAGAFSVRGNGAGSTTVTVSDGVQNSFPISILVQ